MVQTSHHTKSQVQASYLTRADGSNLLSKKVVVGPSLLSEEDDGSNFLSQKVVGPSLLSDEADGLKFNTYRGVTHVKYIDVMFPFSRFLTLQLRQRSIFHLKYPNFGLTQSKKKIFLTKNFMGKKRKYSFFVFYSAFCAHLKI